MDAYFTEQNVKAVLTVVILAAAVYNFVKEKIPPDLTALLALLGLLVSGILTPEEAFSRFSHPATVSVAAVLVLSAAIERSGAVTFLARRVLEPLSKSEMLLTFVIMVVIGLISAFINNTAAVAIFIPVVIEVCTRRNLSPGRILMPMSHAATMGGMCTLIGTSTNLVAHEFAANVGLPGFTMFELGKIGLPMVLVGYAYMLLIGRLFLPKNQPDTQSELALTTNYVAELIVQVDSLWIGREVSAEKLLRDRDVRLIGLRRDGYLLNLETEKDLTYRADDSLVVRGPLQRVLAMAGSEGLVLHRPESMNDTMQMVIHPSTLELQKNDQEDEEKAKKPKKHLAEVVVLASSGLVGKTLVSLSFAERFNTVVLAIRRRGDFRGRPSTTTLHAGDVLVVEGEDYALQQIANRPGFLVIGTMPHPEKRPGKLVITLLTLIGVITIVSLELAPIVTAATTGCAVLMLTGCLRPSEAYQAIDLSLVFLLAGSLALGMALEKTGITALMADGLTAFSAATGPYAVLIGFFITSLIVSELMSNSGTVALLGPVAISTAAQMGMNPMALLAAVTFGSSAAFAMPVGYQTSLMIYGAGGYRFKDFLRMGIVLDIILAVIALWLIPKFWPLNLG